MAIEKVKGEINDAI